MSEKYQVDRDAYERIYEYDLKTEGLQWIVVAGWEYDDEPGRDHEYALGTYPNVFEAFGVAYLHLGSHAVDWKIDKIGTVYELEDEAGYIIYYREEMNNCLNFVKIFVVDHEYGKGGNENDRHDSE